MPRVDRQSIRVRPPGAPLMLQTWSKLLFLHWRVKPALLRALLPGSVDIDLHHGDAWVGVTPFTIPSIHPPRLPSVPVLGSSHEINVRTYVVHDGVPGVWFFSLDANNPLAVAAARLAFRLPYFHARIDLREEGRRVAYTSRRSTGKTPRPEFVGEWTVGERLPKAAADSLEFFLTERYCLYTTHGEALYRARIHHRPWPLHTADVQVERMTMLSAQRIPHEEHEPLAHAQGEPLEVEIWPLEKVWEPAKEAQPVGE